MTCLFVAVSSILCERSITFLKDDVAWVVLEKKKKAKERKGKKKNNTDPVVVHSEVHPSELKITYILFPLFLENCHGHRGGRVASCALKCLKPLQSVLHCLRLPKWNTLNTHSKVWKHEIGTMASDHSTSYFFALPSASLSALSAFYPLMLTVLQMST